MTAPIDGNDGNDPEAAEGTGGPGRELPFQPPGGEEHLEEITAHVERHFGPVARVHHELLSDHVHLDVLVVEPTAERPWYVLVTSGMSDLPMPVPKAGSGPRHAELVVMVSPPESLAEAALADEANYWPIRHLKRLARLPHALGTWFGPGHTIADDPPEPVAPGVPFCGFGVLELLAPEARRLRTRDGLEIAFWQLVPMYRDELEWKLLQADPGVLTELFDAPALRLAMNERPSLKGAAYDARVQHLVDGAEAGRQVLWAIAALVGALAVIDAVACLADGARLPLSRFALTLTLAVQLGQGRRWAYWATLALQVVGIVMGVVVLLRDGLASWRMIGLGLAVPLWAAMVAALLLLPSVRAFYAVHSHRRAA